MVRVDGFHCTPLATAGESFRLRQCQKTPADQESRSENAVEALDKMDYSKGFPVQFSWCQSHAPRAISSLDGPLAFRLL